MWWIILTVVAVLIVGGFVAMLFITLPIAKKVYFKTLVRETPDKWQRECSDTTNEEQVEMWNTGCEWAKQNSKFIKEVQIKNDGIDLYGEFFDFGSDKSVIIIPGRCESLMYSYYFAPPYQQSGYNVLVIDTRAHGKSGGKFNTIGYKESTDVIAWIKFLEKNFNQKKFFIHSICVGTSTAMIAMTSNECPKSVVGLVSEGCFVSFRESYKTHMIYENRPLFPVLDLIMIYIRKYTGAKLTAQAPIKLVKNLPYRVLFLFGRQDVFSRPPKSQKLFDKTNAKEKKIVWFDKGAHSHLRINNTKEYDRAIIDFVD